MRTTIFCALFITASVATATAAEYSDTLRLHAVEVTGEATKAPVQLLPLDVSTVTGTEIQQSTSSSILPVLTHRVPGFFVTERGMGAYGVSGGAAGTVSIRGVGGGNKVLFMIDGQPQWAGIFGHSLPDTYTSADVERVEVVKGPSSLLYGSNAMGGSVNIVTRRAQQNGFHGNARLFWGSYGTQHYGADLAYRQNKFNTFVSATFEKGDGHRRNMQYWLASQFAMAEYAFDSHLRAGANVTLTEMRPHNPGSTTAPLLDMWTQVVRGTASVYLKNTYERANGGIQFYTNWGRHKINDGHSPEAAPKNYLFRSTDYNMGITAYETFVPWQDNDLSLGVDFKHWGGKSWNLMLDGSPDQPGAREHVNEIAGYVMMQQGLFSDHLNLNAGLRLEHSSQFGNVLVPQAGFIGRPFAGNTFKFSWGKGFRSPNIRELYMYPPHNPDLKPEYLWNYEIEWRQLAMNGHLDAGLSLFFIDGKDMIQTAMANGRPLNQNTGRFINKGFELDASFAALPNLTIEANYSYLHTNAAILAAPRNKLFAEVTYHPGQWEFALNNMSVWGLYTQLGNKAITEDYSLLNARVAYNVPNLPVGLKIFCKADNITATKYETILDFPMPRCTVMAGFDLKF